MNYQVGQLFKQFNDDFFILMEEWVLQNALQSGLSACPQQEPSEAVPQVTAFASSAPQFYPSVNTPATARASKSPLRGLVKQPWHALRCTHSGMLLSRTEPLGFIAVTSVFPSYSMFVLVSRCLLFLSWILRLQA